MEIMPTDLQISGTTPPKPGRWERFEGRVKRFFSGRYWKLLLSTPFLLGMFGFAAILGASIWESGLHADGEFLTSAVKELGIAFIIAVIIIMTIEAKSRSEIEEAINIAFSDMSSSHEQKVQEIKQNVFNSLFYRDHDKNIVEYMKVNIFESDFYRKDAYTKFFLKPIPEDLRNEFLRSELDENYPDLTTCETPLILEVINFFSIVNISKGPVDYNFSAFIERPFDKHLEKCVKLLSFSVDGVPIAVPDGNQIPSESGPIKLDKNDDFYTFEYLTKIESGKSVEFEVVYHIIKYSRDNVQWYQKIPCDSYSAQIHFPADLSMYGSPIHSTSSCHREKTDSFLGFRIREPLFPHNGVQFWWSPDTFVAQGESDVSTPVTPPTGRRRRRSPSQGEAST